MGRAQLQALLLQLAVTAVEPRTPPSPFSVRAAGQAICRPLLAPGLAIALTFSDGAAALAERPLQEQPPGAAAVRMIAADDITSSELVSALGRSAMEVDEAWRLAAGESQAAFAGGGSLSRVIAGKLAPAFSSSAVAVADELQVPLQSQPLPAPSPSPFRLHPPPSPHPHLRPFLTPRPES